MNACNIISMKKFSLILVALSFFVGTAAVTINNDKYFEIIKNLEIFNNLFKELNTHYVDDVDPSALMKVGIDAMLETLDPYTNYVSQSQIENYRISAEGRYSGIGVESKEIDGEITITEVLEGGPAHEGDMRAGDVITAVGGRSVEGRSYAEVANILRGAQGSDLSLTVKRPGVAQPLKMVLHRGQVQIPNVPYSGIVSEGIGYISLTTFTQNAGKNVEKALRDLKKDQNLEGVILDLRGNGGGLLFEALNVSNVFIPREVETVFTKGKVIDRDQSYKTRNVPADLEIPLVVLINKNSASASEIVSGVIQDLDRGVLLGQRSYGKGLVQNTKELGYSARLKVTTSKYYIPSGRCIQSVEYEDGEPKDIADDKRAKFKTKNGREVLDGGGVTPDIKIEKKAQPEILQALIDQNIIFKYVTDFKLKNDSIVAAVDFKFNDYDGFKAYVASSGFEYELKNEKLLKEMNENNTDEAAGVIEKINDLQNQLSISKKDDLDEYKDLIIKAIEQDIISRYYFQKGKVQQRLHNDNEVVEAVNVLRDPARYSSLLKP